MTAAHGTADARALGVTPRRMLPSWARNRVGLTRKMRCS